MSVFKDTLATGAAGLGINITQEQLEQFAEFYDLLVETNRSFNLTTVVDEKEAAIKHFIDSLTCLKAATFEDGMSLLDVGAGAGFPGVPLKICRPDLQVTLIEAIGKKKDFIKKAIASLGLNGIEAIHARAEDIGRDKAFRDRYDLVVARAVAGLGVLAEYCLPPLKVGGLFLAMKGPRFEEELAVARKAIGVLGGKSEKVVNLRLPFNEDERSLVLIRKVRPTPGKYPRRAGMPQKNPL